MSNLTINALASEKLFNSSQSTTQKIITAQAGIENLRTIEQAFKKDRDLIQRLMKLNSLVDESEITATKITIDPLVEDLRVLLMTYQLLLARTLLRTSSADFSHSIRSRFAVNDFLIDPWEYKSLHKDAIDQVRVLMINLSEIHGPIPGDNWWTKFVKSFKSEKPVDYSTT